MGKVKNHLIQIEELVYEAMERGFTNTDDVYAYVNTYMSNASRYWVEQVLQEFHQHNEVDYYSRVA